MRRGIPMAGNFLQQENVVLTGACEAIVVDVQCIFPALGPLSKCFHTKFITTSPVAQMPDSEFIRFNAKTAGENAKQIVKMAIENFKNRKPELVHIPQMKQKAVVGFSVEQIEKKLDGVTNTHVDQTGTMMPLVDCVKSGVLRGAVAMVGCNNPKVRPDAAHIELMKKTDCKRYHSGSFRMFRSGSCKSWSDGQESKRSVRCWSETCMRTGGYSSCTAHGILCGYQPYDGSGSAYRKRFRLEHFSDSAGRLCA